MCHEKATLPDHLSESNANGKTDFSMNLAFINPSAFEMQMGKVSNQKRTIPSHLHNSHRVTIPQRMAHYQYSVE